LAAVFFEDEPDLFKLFDEIFITDISIAPEASLLVDSSAFESNTDGIDGEGRYACEKDGDEPIDIEKLVLASTSGKALAVVKDPDGACACASDGEKASDNERYMVLVSVIDVVADLYRPTKVIFEGEVVKTLSDYESAYVHENDFPTVIWAADRVMTYGALIELRKDKAKPAPPTLSLSKRAAARKHKRMRTPDSDDGGSPASAQSPLSPQGRGGSEKTMFRKFLKSSSKFQGNFLTAINKMVAIPEQGAPVAGVGAASSDVTAARVEKLECDVKGLREDVTAARAEQATGFQKMFELMQASK
jgi:hypothetical protein